MDEWTDCDCERIAFTDYLYILYTTGRPDFITTDNFLHFTDFLISNLIGVIREDNTRGQHIYDEALFTHGAEPPTFFFFFVKYLHLTTFTYLQCLLLVPASMRRKRNDLYNFRLLYIHSEIFPA